jgi:hypothetical protein
MGNALENPWGFSHFLTVPLLSLTPPLDLTLVGDPESLRMKELLKVSYQHYLPGRRLVLKNPADCSKLEELVPSAKTYVPPGQEPAAYLCHNYTCQPPVSDPQELAGKLTQLGR